MNDVTARLALPTLQPGQAQKEMTHNEALARLDMAVQATVASAGLDQPPAAPQPGECWIIGAAPGGDWAGRAGQVAGWTEGGWRFLVPVQGMAVWDRATGTTVRRIAGDWVRGEIVGQRLVIGGQQVVGARQPAIAPPAGGATVDGEARAALTALLATLRVHGLLG